MKDVPSINQIQDDIIEEFAAYDDWMDKYSYLIELGNDLAPYPEEHRTQQNVIEGCQSTVWINAELQPDGTIAFDGDSDAIIVKGIVALLIRVLGGHTPSEIVDAKLYFIRQIGLEEHLTPTRSNGLLAMVRQMRLYAVAFKSIENK